MSDVVNPEIIEKCNINVKKGCGFNLLSTLNLELFICLFRVGENYYPSAPPDQPATTR